MYNRCFTIDFLVSKTVHIVTPKYREKYKSLFRAVLPFYTVYDRAIRGGEKIDLNVCDVEGSTFDIHFISDDNSFLEAIKTFQVKVKQLHSTLTDQYR